MTQRKSSIKSMLRQWEAKQKRTIEVTAQRDALLAKIRRQCHHARLVELEAGPPRRICETCGAEEQGWYCGYQVLVLAYERSNVPHAEERVLARRTSNPNEFYCYRRVGPVYPVGQSHPNFAGGGPKTYQELTEIKE